VDGRHDTRVAVGREAASVPSGAAQSGPCCVRRLHPSSSRSGQWEVGSVCVCVAGLGGGVAEDRMSTCIQKFGTHMYVSSGVYTHTYTKDKIKCCGTHICECHKKECINSTHMGEVLCVSWHAIPEERPSCYVGPERLGGTGVPSRCTGSGPVRDVRVYVAQGSG